VSLLLSPHITLQCSETIKTTASDEKPLPQNLKSGFQRRRQRKKHVNEHFPPLSQSPSSFTDRHASFRTIPCPIIDISNQPYIIHKL